MTAQEDLMGLASYFLFGTRGRKPPQSYPSLMMGGDSGAEMAEGRGAESKGPGTEACIGGCSCRFDGDHRPVEGAGR